MAGRCGGRNGIGENSPEAPRSEHELSGPGPQAGGGEEEEQIRGMRVGQGLVGVWAQGAFCVGQRSPGRLQPWQLAYDRKELVS